MLHNTSFFLSYHPIPTISKRAQEFTLPPLLSILKVIHLLCHKEYLGKFKGSVLINFQIQPDSWMYLAESIPWFLKTPPHCKQWSTINLQISSEGCTEPESPYTETRTSSVKQNKVSISINDYKSFTLYMCMLWVLWCLNPKPLFHHQTST